MAGVLRLQSRGSREGVQVNHRDTLRFNRKLDFIDIPRKDQSAEVDEECIGGKATTDESPDTLQHGGWEKALAEFSINTGMCTWEWYTKAGDRRHEGYGVEVERRDAVMRSVRSEETGRSNIVGWGMKRRDAAMRPGEEAKIKVKRHDAAVQIFVSTTSSPARDVVHISVAYEA